MYFVTSEMILSRVFVKLALIWLAFLSVLLPCLHPWSHSTRRLLFSWSGGSALWNIKRVQVRPIVKTEWRCWLVVPFCQQLASMAGVGLLSCSADLGTANASQCQFCVGCPTDNSARLSHHSQNQPALPCCSGSSSWYVSMKKGRGSVHLVDASLLCTCSAVTRRPRPVSDNLLSHFALKAILLAAGQSGMHKTCCKGRCVHWHCSRTSLAGS